VIDPRARAAEPCRCGHERAYHDPCSLCVCPVFLPIAEQNADIVRLWGRDLKARALREGR